MQSTLLTATTVTKVYDGVTAPKTTAAKNIRVINSTANAVNVTLWAGATQGQSTTLSPLASVPANGLIEEAGIYLVTGEYIWAQASVANAINVQVYGPES